ncbi:MAG: diadenylate cyclase CdaA [Candidatus Dormibacteraceae bacterium]
MDHYAANFLNSVGALLHRAGWLEVLDVLVVALILYQLLKLVRGTRAAELIVGLVLLSLIGVIASTLRLVLLSWLFQNAAPFVIFGVIVLFQPELRRALDQVGRLSHLNLQLSSPFSPQAFNRGVAEAIRAAERLSARRTGGLIVFEREVGLDDYAATGVRINGELTAEFLQTIFFPNSPLHDGAVIIRGNVIVAAGCLLPMPEERARSAERLGTRHRAAIGLSQVSDAIILVISEETGGISVVEDGKISRNLDPDGLRSRLVGSLQRARSGNGSRARQLASLLELGKR